MRCALLSVLLSLLLSQSLAAEPGAGPSNTLSTASTASFQGAAALMSGVREGVSYTLVALEPLGDGALAVFKASGSSTRVALEISGDAVRVAARALGEVLEPVATAGGTLLELGGEVIAFLPNQRVRTMHHRERVRP